MSAHPPVQFDRALRPEWFDRALAVRAETKNAAEFRAALKAHLQAQVQGRWTLDKLVQQFQRTVGFRSPLPPERLAEALRVLSESDAGVRQPVRLQLLLEAVPFLADCAQTIVRLADASGDTFTLGQLTARVQERYGHRKGIPPTVRHALQTLEAFGALGHRYGKWERLGALSAAVAVQP